MVSTEAISFEDYAQKISQVETMLKEIKSGLLSYEKEVQKSEKRGMSDIKKGKVSVCKTEKDLDKFFNSL